jgi:Flp pilus assembly protein TadG
MSVLRRLGADDRGAAIIEFAVLAPVVMGLMLGVLQIGLQMQNYNALRSVAADTVRYTMIEYQKEDKLTADQIQSKAIGYATNTPYGLVPANLVAAVTTPATDIAGMKKFQLVMTYTPPNLLGVIEVHAPTMTWTRVFYVTAT